MAGVDQLGLHFGVAPVLFLLLFLLSSRKYEEMVCFAICYAQDRWLSFIVGV